ncbi:hypothetical protein B9479_007445 [Cryptococcus floricola]|uniref:Uncharacterized protein n=1 Tax=Cryptococcus floricola TaxID=2591691 RepID=A0A5D3AQJ5_9TREE|nr:hypothetical protein B9479_007445 [Cryptococcus floricola]
MTTTKVSIRDMRAWGLASVHIRWEEEKSSQRYVSNITTIGLPKADGHPRVTSEKSVTTALDESLRNIVNSALKEAVPAESPTYFHWSPDDTLHGTGTPDYHLYNIKKEGGGKDHSPSDRLIEVKKEAVFRCIAAQMMRALDGPDGIWLREDVQRGMSMSGDFDESEDGNQGKRVRRVRMAICQCVKELVTRQAKEVLFTTYSLGFIVRFDRSLII